MRLAGKADPTKPNETQARLSNGGLFRACLSGLLLRHGGGRVVTHSKERIKWGDYSSGSVAPFKRILRGFRFA